MKHFTFYSSNFLCWRPDSPDALEKGYCFCSPIKKRDLLLTSKNRMHLSKFLKWMPSWCPSPSPRPHTHKSVPCHVDTNQKNFNGRWQARASCSQRNMFAWNKLSSNCLRRLEMCQQERSCLCDSRAWEISFFARLAVAQQVRKGEAYRVWPCAYAIDTVV